MKKLSIILLFSITVSNCFGQKAEMIDLKHLLKIISAPGEKLRVLNFWATWCAPCVKELPEFEKLSQQNKSVDVILVSMDYDLDTNPDKVNRFIVRKNLVSKVYMLTERDPNSWIDKIDRTWSGALPFTLIVDPKTSKRKSFGRSLKEGELDEIIKDLTK